MKIYVIIGGILLNFEFLLLKFIEENFKIEILPISILVVGIVNYALQILLSLINVNEGFALKYLILMIIKMFSVLITLLYLLLETDVDIMAWLLAMCVSYIIHQTLSVRYYLKGIKTK